MVEQNSTQSIPCPPIPVDEGWPRMVAILRSGKEIAAIGSADAEDAAKQAAILILQVDGGLRIGDLIQVSRI